MAKVLLGDVVDHVKDKVDKDSTDLEFYVGGEHIDGDEITVRRRGHIEGSTIGPAFHTRFQQGDVLLMSRNPHLRKASMVDFDGICSDVSYVCRTKDNNVLLQSLLPFILQTPEFWQFAEENKKGGLPFFLNWKDFARFEFELIPIDRQQQISNLLWTMERTKNAYRELIAKTDELVKSQFIEMFGDPERNPLGWPVMRLDSIVTNSNNGITRRGNDPDGSIVLRIVELQDGFIDYSNVNRMDIKDKEQKCRLVDGDLLFVRVNGNPDYVARSAVFSDIGEPVYHNDHIIRMHVDETKAYVRFIREFTTTDYAKKQLKDHVKTSAGQYSISQDGIGSIQLVLPPLDKQGQFISFLEQSDKSKFEAQQTLKELTDAQKALMKKIFEQ